jgi:hypothetical protein
MPHFKAKYKAIFSLLSVANNIFISSVVRFFTHDHIFCSVKFAVLNCQDPGGLSLIDCG